MGNETSIADGNSRPRWGLSQRRKRNRQETRRKEVKTGCTNILVLLRDLDRGSDWSAPVYEGTKTTASFPTGLARLQKARAKGWSKRLQVQAG